MDETKEYDVMRRWDGELVLVGLSAILGIGGMLIFFAGMYADDEVVMICGLVLMGGISELMRRQITASYGRHK